jgi:hypothetical protein
MAMTEAEAIDAAMRLRDIQQRERQEFDVLRLYATGKQALPLVVPKDAPAEVRELARISRINLIKIVIMSLVESLYLDNIRVTQEDIDVDPEAAGGGLVPPQGPDNVIAPIWQALQANRFDRGQSGLYRAVFEYGIGYVIATPGKPEPVIRTFSPRSVTALYSDDEPDYPRQAFERRRNGGYRFYEQSGTGGAQVWTFAYDADKKTMTANDGPADLGVDYVPVIRYVADEDLDLDDEPMSPEPFGQFNGRNTTCIVAGEVAPLMTLQDQQDVSSFALASAMWYSAFRQRWIVGWTPENTAAKMKAGASQMWTFEDSPEDVKLGEFSETSLDGFLRAREAVLKYGATLSQTPVHELIGELVNLSAEALAAAEAGRDRKVDLAKTCLGESHEQLAQTIGEYKGIEVPDTIEVVWKDTSARAFGALIDGLGKVATMLNVPPQALWDRIPGVTRQDVVRWRQMASEGDSLGQLTKLLNTQAAGAPGAPTPNPDGTTTTGTGLVLPRGVTA